MGPPTTLKVIHMPLNRGKEFFEIVSLSQGTLIFQAN
jgi:hypothetical protein